MKLGPLQFHISRAAHSNGQSQPKSAAPTSPKGTMRTVLGGIAADLGEYNNELRWPYGLRVYDRMRRSDGQVKASLSLVKAPVVSAQWYVQPFADTDFDREVAEFVTFNLHNMHQPWVIFVHEALGMLDFGHYVFEPIFETIQWRPPPNDNRPKSRFRPVTKWLTLAPRTPMSIDDWRFKDDGSLDYIVQYSPDRKEIPADNLVIFTYDQEGGDPRGMSVLRSAYPHWYYKTHLYKVDAMQKERHGLGIPEAELAPNLWDDPKERKAADEMLANLRANERAFVSHPQGMAIRFLKPEGNLVNVLESAQHHGLMILQNVLVQFLSLGSQESGSRAVGNTQLDAFQRATRYLADMFRGVVNQDLIPQLVDYNYDVDGYPELRARRVGEDTELRTLAAALVDLVRSGALTPDAELEGWVRQWADLPLMSRIAEERGIEQRVAQVQERVQGPPVEPGRNPTAPPSTTLQPNTGSAG